MPDEPPYRVAWSRRAIDVLKDVRRQGHPVVGPKESAATIRKIDERLRHDPLGFGEIYRSRKPVEEHLGVCDGVAVDFAVDDLRKFVLVRNCWILSGPAA